MIENLVITDLVGNKITEGDFVAYATSCTSTGYLRRGIVHKIHMRKNRWRSDETYLAIELRSINFNKPWNRVKHTRDNEFQIKVGAYTISFYNGVQLPAVQRISVIKLNPYYYNNFSAEELAIINTTKRWTKDLNGNRCQVMFADILTNPEIRNKLWGKTK